MKCCQLNKQNNKNLIVFFAGWSFDEKPFGKLVCDGFDILFIYDYNELNLPKELENLQNYEHKYLLAWSMGVFVAYEFRKLFEDFDYKIAINGTITPVDNECGIPVKMFELTLKHAAKGLAGKFYQNVFKNSEEFEIYSKTPVQRTIENRVSELENLYNIIKMKDYKKAESFYDCAIVSDFDKIIPPKNQIASHQKNNEPIITLPFGHFPFYNFTSWSEIIKCCQTTKNHI